MYQDYLIYKKYFFIQICLNPYNYYKYKRTPVKLHKIEPWNYCHLDRWHIYCNWNCNLGLVLPKDIHRAGAREGYAPRLAFSYQYYLSWAKLYHEWTNLKIINTHYTFFDNDCQEAPITHVPLISLMMDSFCRTGYAYLHT